MAVRGVYTTDSAKMTLPTPGPRAATSPIAIPPRDVRSIVLAPTSSEIWAPCRTRLYTSRPNSSVPSRFLALGAFRRSAGLSRRGSCVDIAPASNAAMTTTASIAAPTVMLRLRPNRRIHAPRPAARGSAAAARSAAASLIADSRVDDHVERVDRQIDEYVGRRGDQDHALHDRVVPPQHRRDDQASEPGNVEHDLGHHGAADQDRHRDADDRDDRHQRIAQGVDIDDPPL